jgi:hypothetical protein
LQLIVCVAPGEHCPWALHCPGTQAQLTQVSVSLPQSAPVQLITRVGSCGLHSEQPPEQQKPVPPGSAALEQTLPSI